MARALRNARNDTQSQMRKKKLTVRGGAGASTFRRLHSRCRVSRDTPCFSASAEANCPPSAARSRSSPSSLRLADSSLRFAAFLSRSTVAHASFASFSALCLSCCASRACCATAATQNHHTSVKNFQQFGGGESLRFAHSNKDKSNSTTRVQLEVTHQHHKTTTICSLLRSSSLCPDAVFSRSRVCIAIQQHGSLSSVHGLGCTLRLRYTHSNSSTPDRVRPRYANPTIPNPT